MLIKICGITNLEDAQNAALFGANAIGFVFAKSPRQVSPEKAKEIIERVEKNVMKVGVFVDEGLEKLEETSLFCGLDLVQLHGNENPDYCSKIKRGKVIKAFRVKDKAVLPSMNGYDTVFAYLLDTFSSEGYGGTGKYFDWRVAVKVKALGKPVILSGGIGLGNVADAIRAVKPYGVDISSSIEVKPGKKDPVLMRRLIESIKALD
ncbi:MAG: phosphoribosylanthranilate isomerase [Candidatus Omnitrophica bacterium]|nr:phosphoribosylanthranilate isomerase [Candidatus Omnitrophota bacterium]MBU4487624.1 phosphoribosylanthranilate isomerase [Candidatus Omnitrophota bacterium]MCG2705043.1 phosphoribosylanthranilate isomerase [Candidatus Omnitrophota bacterium]